MNKVYKLYYVQKLQVLNLVVINPMACNSCKALVVV
jgi:hypothetical protein